MNCPNPNCKRGMSHSHSRGATMIYRCGVCGAEVAVVPRNEQRVTKGAYASKGTLNIIDKNR